MECGEEKEESRGEEGNIQVARVLSTENFNRRGPLPLLSLSLSHEKEG